MNISKFRLSFIEDYLSLTILTVKKYQFDELLVTALTLCSKRTVG